MRIIRGFAETCFRASPQLRPGSYFLVMRARAREIVQPPRSGKSNVLQRCIYVGRGVENGYDVMEKWRDGCFDVRSEKLPPKSEQMFHAL